MSGIVIKELLPSDSISALVEKSNFNWDQLLLAGGGPPGVPGATGPSGPPGPLGPRGSKWLVGPSAGPTALQDGDPLEALDQYLEADGDVFTYFDISGSTGWTYSGVNLMGPTGSTGLTGSSFEWQYYPGYTGGVQDAGTFGPTTGNSTSVYTPNVDWIAPAGGGKNSVFVGDRQWAYEWLSDFNTQPIGTNQLDSPKLTLLQNQINYEGLNGLAFGSYGLTSGASGADMPAIGTTGNHVTALDFVHMGFVRTTGTPEYQRFRINSYRMPMAIQVGGDSDFYRPADLSITSKQIRIEDYTGLRSIRHMVNSSIAVGVTQSYVEITAKPDNFQPFMPTVAGTVGYIALQSTGGFISNFGPGNRSINNSHGSVFIGPTYNSSGLPRAFTLADPSALVISRTISSITNNVDSALKFYSSTPFLNGVNDFIAKMVPAFSAELGTPAATFQLSGRRVAINSRFDQNETGLVPRFPFHVNQRHSNASILGDLWAGTVAPAPLNSWIAGFDSVDSSTGIYTPKGLGIGYSVAQTVFNGTNRELVLQTYFRGAADPAGHLEFVSPHLSAMIGDEQTHGNLFLGGVREQFVTEARAKLSVVGSVNVGSTGYFTAATPLGPKWGIRSQGSVLQGSTTYDPVTDVLSAAQVTTLIGSTYGFFSPERAVARKFVATDNGGSFTNPDPSFAMTDLRSGIRGGDFGGEVYLQVAYSTGGFSRDVARASSKGEGSTGSNLPGFQVLYRNAVKPSYVSGYDMFSFCETIPSFDSTPTVLCTVPTSHSVIKFDGNGSADIGGGAVPWSTRYEQSAGLPVGSARFITELEDGVYDGQELELAFAGWGIGSTPFVSAAIFTLRNNARYQFATGRTRMLLGREFNGGAYVPATPNLYGNDGSTLGGLPYPHPHGSRNAGGVLSSDSLDNAKWSTDGQFTAWGYKTLRLRWMRTVPTNYVLSDISQVRYRWVETSRNSIGVDRSLQFGPDIGGVGYTTY